MYNCICKLYMNNPINQGRIQANKVSRYKRCNVLSVISKNWKKYDIRWSSALRKLLTIYLPMFIQIIVIIYNFINIYIDFFFLVIKVTEGVLNNLQRNWPFWGVYIILNGTWNSIIAINWLLSKPSK